jgi:hypothetical protein
MIDASQANDAGRRAIRQLALASAVTPGLESARMRDLAGDVGAWGGCGHRRRVQLAGLCDRVPLIAAPGTAFLPEKSGRSDAKQV